VRQGGESGSPLESGPGVLRRLAFRAHPIAIAGRLEERGPVLWAEDGLVVPFVILGDF